MKVATYKICYINVPDMMIINKTECSFIPSEDHTDLNYLGCYKIKNENFTGRIVLNKVDKGVKISTILSHVKDDGGSMTYDEIEDDMRSLNKRILLHSKILSNWIWRLNHGLKNW